MASKGLIDKGYVSALDPLIDTREINKLVTDIYNEEELTDILGFADKKMPTKQPWYSTYVNESIFKLGNTSQAAVTGSGSPIVTVTFTQATSNYTRVNDLILFPNSMTGIVASVSTTSGIDTVVIESVNGANLTCTQGDKLSIYSMAFGENSVSPENIRYGVSRTFNKYQIFRETSKITDIQNASTIEIGNGKWTFKEHWEKTIKLKGSINAAFWANDMSNTSFGDNNPQLSDPLIYNEGNNKGGGMAIQTTRGVNKYVELYGTSLVNGTLGTYQKANLDDLCDTLTSVRAPKRQLCVGSDKVLRTVSTYYKALGSSGVQSVRLVVGGKELDMNVDRIKYGKYELNYANMPILDHPTLFSQTDIAKSLYCLPFDGKVKVVEGGSEDQIRVRYVPKQTPYGNDMINEIHGGALSPVNPNGQAMNVSVDWVTYQGLEVLAPQHLVRQKVVA